MTEQPPEAPAVGTDPAPLPAQWVVTPLGPPAKLVVVVVNDASGQRILFLEPDAAIAIAGELTKSARQARSGLVLGQIPPNGHNRGHRQ